MPLPWITRDLLHKLTASLKFTEGGMHIKVGQDGPTTIMVTVPLGEEGLLTPVPNKNVHAVNPLLKSLQADFPHVWAETNPPGLAIYQAPIIVELKASALLVRVKQYPMSREARRGIAIHIKRLRDSGILIPCKSPWNTLLLPVQKPNSSDFWPVQDLRAVNARVMDIHPTVPNPYTLLSLLPPSQVYYTVLDLKDAFFAIPLAPQSQPLFAFEWTDPKEGKAGQLTWTRLPQGFKNSRTLFNEALHQDLEPFRIFNPQVTLLQYVNDILLAAPSHLKCLSATKELLSLLQKLGYRVSARKAQICRTAVAYLGYNLKKGKHYLGEQRIRPILDIPQSRTRKQVREFLGATSYCRL